MSNNKKYTKPPVNVSPERISGEEPVSQVLLPPPEPEVETIVDADEVEGHVTEDNAEAASEPEVATVVDAEEIEKHDDADNADLETAAVVTLTVAALDYIMILCAQYIGMAAYAGLSEDIVKAIEEGRQVVVFVDPLRVVITDLPFVSVDRSLDVADAGTALNVNRKLADARMLD